MVAKLLTAASVTRIKPDPKRRLEIPDRQQPGLYLVVQPSGRRSFAVRTRVAGKTVKITLGDAEALELGKARDQAKDLIKGARSGSDPRVEKAEAHANTVAAVVEEYVTRRLKPRLKDWERVAKRLRRDLVPAYGSRPIASLTRADIIRLLDGMGDRGVKQGRNRTLATIRPFLAWALERGIVETNAAAGIRPPVKEMARDRILDDAEVAAVWMACGSLGFPFGPLIRLMLVTAQREGECAGMRWRDVDLEQPRLDPATRADQGRPGAHGALERARSGDAGRRARACTWRRCHDLLDHRHERSPAAGAAPRTGSTGCPASPAGGSMI